MVCTTAQARPLDDNHLPSLLLSALYRYVKTFKAAKTLASFFPTKKNK